MIRKIVNYIVIFLFGSRLIQKAWYNFLGNKWRGLFLGLIRYKALYMVNSGETVILAGVFSDEYVADYAKIVGVNGKVIVVEANPENIKRLEEKCKNLKQVKFINRAIWGKRGKTTFLLASAEQAQGYNRIDDESIAEFPKNLVNEVKKITIETCTLDDISHDLCLDKVHQINLTINGAELYAVDGIVKTQSKNPNIRFYINAQYPTPGLEVVKKFKSKGFKVYTSRLITTTNKKIKLVRIYAFS